MKIKFLLLISMFVLASCNLVEPDPDNYDWCYTYDFAADASFVNLVDGVWESGLGLKTVDGSLAFNFQKSGLYVSHADVQEMTVTVRRGEYFGTISVAARFDIFGMAGIFRENFIEARTEYTASLMSYISERTPQGPDGSEDSNIVNVNIQTAEEMDLYIKSFAIYGKGASPFSPNACDDAEPTSTPEPAPTNTPEVTPTPPPSSTPDNCYLHNTTFNVFATGGEWASTPFVTSPACTYVVEISRQYIKEDNSADAFYTRRPNELGCDPAKYSAQHCIMWDFTQDKYGWIAQPWGTSVGTWAAGTGWESAIGMQSIIPVNGLRVQSPERIPGTMQMVAFESVSTYIPGKWNTGGGPELSLNRPLVWWPTTSPMTNASWAFSTPQNVTSTILNWNAQVGYATGGLNPPGSASLSKLIFWWNGTSPGWEPRWQPENNLIFESVPNIEFLWHDSPPARNPAGNYLAESIGTGHPFRFRIPEQPNSSGHLTVRVYAGEVLPSPTPSATIEQSPTIEPSPTPTHTPSATMTRTPIGYNGGTPTLPPTATRTAVVIKTWTPQPPTLTRTPSRTPIPPTIAATPTYITVTPITHTPVHSPTVMPSLPGPTMTPWGTPIIWGTPWGTPVDWGTPWLPGDGGFGGICCGDGSGNYDDAVYGWLATAAAEVNNLPDSIEPYIPNPNTSQIFGYAKWLLSCVSAQEIVGRTLSPIVCHLSFGLQIILFVTSVYLSIRLIALAFRIGAWIVRRMAGSVLSIIFGFLANVMRGGLVWAARLIGRFFGGPIGWIISAIAAIAGIFGLVSEEFGFDNLINQAIDSIGEFLAPIFAPITEPLNKIAEMTTMVFDIVLGIFSFLATVFFEGFNSLIGILLDYASSPVLAIPTLPQCTTAPMQHNLCALWYLLDWTFLAESTPGALIIPLIVVALDIYMIIFIVRRVFNIIRTGERTIASD